MNARFLFPHKLRYLGYLLAVPALILGFLVLFKQYEIPGFELLIHKPNITLTGNNAEDAKLLAMGKQPENFTNELALTLALVSLSLMAFSRLKREDELTGKIRLNALYWAILINYLLYAAVQLFLFGADISGSNLGGHLLGPFIYEFVYETYNLFFPLLIFLLIFFYQLYRYKNKFTVNEVRYLPHKPYNTLGKVLSVIFLIWMIYNQITTGKPGYVFLLFPLSMILWIYSKNQNQDEYINSIRLEAMQIAVYASTALLLIANFIFYSYDFWYFETVNLITIPVIFVAWFQYRLYRLNNQTEISAVQS